MDTRAVVINQYGGKDQLKESTVSLPKLEENQVLVSVQATSINPIDWKLREGYLQQKYPWDFPIVLGWDVAGVIVDVGQEVTNWQVGDKVFARPQTTRFGTYADYTIVNENLLVSIPDNTSYKEAAAVPLAGLTAYQVLFDHGELEAGQKVLIHAGSGGVGTFAIQLAKLQGAYVYTTASKKNHELLQSLGADETIDYHTTDFTEVVSQADLVLDALGGSKMQQQSMEVLKPHGYLISLSAIEDPSLAKEKQINAKGIWLDENGEQLQVLADYMKNDQLKSVLATSYPLSQKGIYQAHELSETNHAVGKIVIDNES
ncbi:NADP-dependent oxidoreductase [Tetragenococcus muriaticus]|uniref:Zinc-containing alcohol dehydrogenase/quinone oxidoreductase n=2 Tax=Tetragenococcus muriaticus TaxID=64642 RepID=A0A091C694_9ENTE|nr:NADP-dependent oxidoreductase [Tetragenococcus muriaticus]KFN92384.1 zinc-containing alcohol dehydrogenase/quinone oxidoreductase [Tetragenococcus muriaticus 3MR10-3]GMA47775.1 NADPH:quinone reductase [Tetragenococcus muriaticus]